METKAEQAGRLEAEKAQAGAQADMETKAEARAVASHPEKSTAEHLDALAQEFEIDPTEYSDAEIKKPAITIAHHWKDHPTHLPDGEHGHAPSGRVFHIASGRLVKVTEGDPDRLRVKEASKKSDKGKAA